MECFINSFGQAVLATAVSIRHDGYSAIAQHHFNISKVDVLNTVHGYHFNNGANGRGESFIGLLKTIDDREIGIDIFEPLIIDNQQGINFISQRIDTV